MLLRLATDVMFDVVMQVKCCNCQLVSMMLLRPATDVMFVATVVKCCIDVMMQVKCCNCQLMSSDVIATGD